MNKNTLSAAPQRRMTELGGFIAELAATAIRLADRSLGPLVELAARLWLAQVFFVSGVLKVSNWDTALYLAANEYPVSWLSPVSAAYIGATIELGGSVLLALGLGTRVAALAIAALSLVIQFNYVALDVHLFWVALAGWFIVRGPGPLSLDAMLARGLADTALPLAAAAVRTANWTTRFVAPVYQLVLRCWIGAALVAVILVHAVDGAPVNVAAQVGLWLPLRSAADFGFGVVWVCALLFALGLGARLAALVLIGLALALQMAAWHSDHAYWLLALGLVAVRGPGILSLDELVQTALRRAYPQLDGKPAFSLEGLPRVVIVGAGFGGLTCAAALSRARATVTLIDRHNYHLFQPLLYQVATAALSPGDIATPIRGLFREQFNTRVVLGQVTAVSTVRREVQCGSARIPYDFLVLATGASHSYFGSDEWEPYAPGLKKVEDATEVRRRLLLAFERAEACDDEREREALLTFLIVGGGPTGVELAGAIAELARHGMDKEFRRFDPASARVLLVQAAPRLLPTFSRSLSDATQRSLERLGVEVMLNSRVEAIDDAGVSVNGNRIAGRTVLWAAGVTASAAARWLNVPADSAGRIKVGADLSVPGAANVFAIGDTAASLAWQGRQVPGLAPAAKQGGAYVASVIRARIEGRRNPAPFRYLHLGSLATIGRKAAVADFGPIQLSGAAAWWLWGLIHVSFLVGVRNRLSVMFDWFWAYLTYRNGTRLITGGAQYDSSAVRRQVDTNVALRTSVAAVTK